MSVDKKSAGRRKRLSRTERRIELLNGAIQVAADVGLGNLVHAEIAKSCDVSIATVFSYFPDSESLIRSTIEEIHRFYRAQCDYYLDKEVLTPDDIMAFGAAFTLSIDTHRDYAAVFLQWAASVGNAYGMWDLFAEHMLYVEERVAAGIRDDASSSSPLATEYADTLSQLLVGSAFTILRRKFAGAGEEEIQKYLNQSIEIYNMLSAYSGSDKGREQ